MTLALADISNHQPTSWRPASNEKIIFILATDGHSWESPTHDDQVKLARALNRRVGHYHWLRPGNIQAQVDWFWSHANPKPGDVVIVDWEQSGTSNADKDQFLQLLDKKIPRTAILKRRRNQRALYCNRNYWLNYDKTSFVGEALWIAEYGVSKPGIQFPWTFWQYTDSPYDRSRSIFDTLTEYDAWSNPKDTAGPAPTPAPGVKTVPVYPSLNAIHTPFGQWGSSWSWNRGKNTAHPTWGQHGGDDWHRGAGLAEIGDPVYAVADGTIIYAGDATHTDAGWGSAFGIHTLLKWDTGGRTSVDGHMSKLHVKTGDKVKAGDKIGEKGMTGNVSGPHVHHEDHMGTRWTDKRVKPIYPGIKITTTDPTPAPPDPTGDDEIMAPTKYRRKTNQTLKADAKNWQSLKVDDKDASKYGITHGPGTVDVRADIVVNKACKARFVTMDWKPGENKLITPYPPKTIQPGGDQIQLWDTISGPGAGYKQRIVRLQVFTSTGTTVTDLLIRAARKA